MKQLNNETLEQKRMKLWNNETFYYNFAAQKDDPSSSFKIYACLKAGGGKY